MRTSNRAFRKHLAALVRRGQVSLRVVGSGGMGFFLAAERNGNLFAVGPLQGWKRQHQAILYGIRKWGVKARKKIANT